MPKVSVIIPTYNCSEYICEAIDSVLSQTYKDYEIIVIDDGSTDDTEELLLKYKGIIKYFYQENKGVSAARNLGIKEAIGAYIAFLDNDDIWFPNKLRLQLEIMDSNPEAAMIFTDGESFDKKGVIRHSFKPSIHTEDKNSFKYKICSTSFNSGSSIKGYAYEDLIDGNLVIASSALIRKEYLKKIGYFDEKLPINQDYNLWIRIANKYPILYLNQVTVKYRVRDDATSGSSEIRGYLYNEHDAKMLEKHLKECPNKYKNLIKKRISKYSRTVAWWYLINNNYSRAREYSFKSLAYNKKQIKLYLYILVTFLPTRFINSIRKIKYIVCQK